MKPLILLSMMVFTITIICQSFAQVNLTSGTVQKIDFNSYNGTGYVPTPSNGQLDSDTWKVLGLSDGDMAFGGTYTTGDFARGSSSGHIITGGCYAFDVGGGNMAMGIQPGESDFTPGHFILRIQNNTGGTLSKINIQYDIFYYNDQDRANSLNFSYSTDDNTYTTIPALDFTSPEVADASPVWASVQRTTSITGLSVANGDYIYVSWTGNDVSGSGSRDEFAMDNILLSEGDTSLPVELTAFTAVPGDATVQLHWSTASEVNNQGFEILRSEQRDDSYQILNSYISDAALKGAGNSSKKHSYSYTDQTVINGTSYWYKLVDVDINGIRTEHGPIVATPQAVDLPDDQRIPKEFYIANYPNPFGQTNAGIRAGNNTTIAFDLSSFKGDYTRVELTIFNQLGEKVKTLYKGNLSNQYHSFNWQGLNEQYQPVPSGIYFYTFKTAQRTISKKMILLR